MEGRRLVLGFAMLLAACSGAEKQDVLQNSSGGASTSGGQSSGGQSSGTSGTSGSSGSSGSSGINTTDCTPEQEKNDSRDTANVISGSRCGALTLDDQVDFLTFKLKASTKEMKLNFKGSVKLKIDIEGRDPIELTPTSNVAVPFVMGKAYVIEIKAIERQESTPWRVDVVEN